MTHHLQKWQEKIGTSYIYLNHLATTKLVSQLYIVECQNTVVADVIRDFALDYLDIAKFSDTPDYYELSANGLSVDKARQLVSRYTFKIPDRAVLYIRDADYLALAVQTSFLKFFEEPPKGLTILLSCKFSCRLLPTVLSRAQLISVSMPNIAANIAEVDAILDASREPYMLHLAVGEVQEGWTLDKIEYFIRLLYSRFLQTKEKCLLELMFAVEALLNDKTVRKHDRYLRTLVIKHLSSRG